MTSNSRLFLFPDAHVELPFQGRAAALDATFRVALQSLAESRRVLVPGLECSYICTRHRVL